MFLTSQIEKKISNNSLFFVYETKALKVISYTFRYVGYIFVPRICE